MFNGDGAQEVTSFLTVDEDAPRPFPINSSMGRKLLEQLPDHPVRLMIHPSEPCLIMTAEFIVDLLSRDKIRGQLTPGSENADIQIAFVPIDADVPWSTLRAVHDLLDENEPRTRSQREAMELVEAYINTAANSTDSATTVRFCKLAEQILIHDLGAFPLFRPTLYLYTSPSIIGLGFDENGRLDISNMVKLKLPSPSEGLEE
jgi:MarR-like DNA-binding transcriptional regulator SgrR of sgrS sRNA